MYQSPFAQVQIRLSELAQSPDPCYNLLKCPFLYSMPYYSKGPTLPYVPRINRQNLRLWVSYRYLRWINQIKCNRLGGAPYLSIGRCLGKYRRWMTRGPIQHGLGMLTLERLPLLLSIPGGFEAPT